MTAGSIPAPRRFMRKDGEMSQVTVWCESCGWEGPAEQAMTAFSVYHDLQCPECGTTYLDTSGLNKDWASRGQKYAYGDGNTIEFGHGKDGDQ